MTASMHMWIGVCLCSGREPVADPSVLHMACIVLTIGPPAREEPRCRRPGRAAQRETVAFAFFFSSFFLIKSPGAAWRPAASAHGEAHTDNCPLMKNVPVSAR